MSYHDPDRDEALQAIWLVLAIICFLAAVLVGSYL